MQESFIFYRSFFEAIKDLDDKKRLKMYDSIANFALNHEKIEDLEGICKQLFVLIEPQLSANIKRYEDGIKGGRPKKQKTSGFEKIKTSGFENKKPNYNDNYNVNENDNVNVNVNYNENDLGFLEEKKISKKTDPFINHFASNFKEVYKKEFGAIPYLQKQDYEKILELGSTMDNFVEDLPQAISKLKALNFSDIAFKPTASWLLKDNNYARLMNGEFDDKTATQFSATEALRRIEERKKARERLEQALEGAEYYEQG